MNENPQQQSTPSGIHGPREWPAVAVIMPVRNEARYIEKTLGQIAAQDYPKDKIEVVIADGRSMDSTVAIASNFEGKFGSLKIVTNEVGGPAAGRNVGVRNSTAPYVILIDGHVYIPSKRLFKDMVYAFEAHNVDCLCRAQPLDPPDINLFQKAIAVARSSFLGHNPGSDIYSEEEKETDPTSSGAMWRREVFEKLGEFDERFFACEDVDFNHRIMKSGMRAWLSPKLKVFYYPRDSVRGLWQQMLRYGSGRYLFSKKHKNFSVKQLLAPLGAAWFVFHAFLSITGVDWAQSWLAVSFNFYAVIVGLTTLGLSVKHRQSALIFSLPVIFPVIHFGLGFGYLKEWLKSFRKSDPKPQPAGA